MWQSIETKDSFTGQSSLYICFFLFFTLKACYCSNLEKYLLRQKTSLFDCSLQIMHICPSPAYITYTNEAYWIESYKKLQRKLVRSSGRLYSEVNFYQYSEFGNTRELNHTHPFSKQMPCADVSRTAIEQLAYSGRADLKFPHPLQDAS